MCECAYLCVGSHLVVEEEEATEEAVEVGGEQRQVDSGGTGPPQDHRHEAVQPKHAGTEPDVQQA